MQHQVLDAGDCATARPRGLIRQGKDPAHSPGHQGNPLDYGEPPASAAGCDAAYGEPGCSVAPAAGWDHGRIQPSRGSTPLRGTSP